MRDNVLGQHVDVVLKLRRDGQNGCVASDGSGDKVFDLLPLCNGVLWLYKVNLVLQNDNVAELHDLHSRKVLAGLCLGAGLVACN